MTWERQCPHWHTSRQRQRVDAESCRDVKTWVHKERDSQKRAVMPQPSQYVPQVIIRCLPMWKLAFPGARLNDLSPMTCNTPLAHPSDPTDSPETTDLFKSLIFPHDIRHAVIPVSAFLFSQETGLYVV